ncbi:MAG: helix-turn-helix transcriptional regulator [Synergistaceae bacterium]|nr:helix-turn-helix transcriptional regulator [Synergistaceae bacterium]
MIKKYWRIFIAFSFAETARLMFLRFSFRMLERTGLHDGFNFAFIVQCVGIAAGLAAVSAAIEKFDTSPRPIFLTGIYRGLALFAVVCVTASYFALGYTSVAFQFLSMFAVAGLMAVCIEQLAVGAVEPFHIGRFVGGAYVVMTLTVNIVFFVPSAVVPTPAILAVTVTLIVLSAAAFTPVRRIKVMTETGGAPSPISYPPPAREIIARALAAIAMYAIIAGILDNVFFVFFFEDAFENVPNFMFMLFIYESAVKAAAGWLFDKRRWTSAATASFLLICVGQATTFFSRDRIPALPYAVFTMAGNDTLLLILFCLPILFAAPLKKTGVLPVLGYVTVYVSFAMASAFFEYIPESMYHHVLGILMLISLAAIFVIHPVDGLYAKYRYDLLREQKPSVNNDRAKFAFSPKEREVLEYLLTGIMTSEIAAKMFISERTVNFHISSLLKKTGSRNRVELVTRVKSVG